MRATLIIDGVDFSSFVNKYVYSVEYIKREGQNGGVMLDGSLTVDVLARKAVITVETNGSWDTQLSDFLAALDNDTVVVEYTDPKTGTTRTGNFIPEVNAAAVAFYRGDRVLYKPVGVTLTEV